MAAVSTTHWALSSSSSSSAKSPTEMNQHSIGFKHLLFCGFDQPREFNGHIGNLRRKNPNKITTITCNTSKKEIRPSIYTHISDGTN